MNYLAKIAVLFFFVVAIVSCSLDSSSNPEEINNNKANPNSPSPSDKASNEPIYQTLKWESENAKSFDVYFGKTNPPTTRVVSNLDKKTFVISNLEYATVYYWRVISKFGDGTQKEGPVWSFTTLTNPNPAGSGYAMQLVKLEKKLPDIVNVLFQVVDMNRIGVPNLVKENFEIFEDGEPITSESTIEIKRNDQLPYKIRTVLMLDNSTSLDGKYDQIREAASLFIRNLRPNQEVAIYQFSESPELIIDFTSNKDSLLKYIANYRKGFMTTNLYGAVIRGASRWEDKFTVDDLLQGSMIIFTDGKDTQGSSSLVEAVNAVGNKTVYTVGLAGAADGIDVPILTAIGTKGFYPISDISQLTENFNKIQQSIVNFANSFYLMTYKSPKRGNFDHFLTIKIKDNSYMGSEAYITGIYNSSGFYSANWTN
jgi:hypothetical protein